MSELAEEITSLEDDASFAKPLRRVAYEAGMLLGLEATQDEQDYHRRRLSRHQYWLQGSGTLAGMVVAVDPPGTTETGPIETRLTVGPGIGIDGLGREVLINETYCIDLGDWLKSQNETTLRDGYDEVADELWLKITVRYQACNVAMQPVLARKVNLSTDAVQASRRADSIVLEITPELPPAEDDRFKPWAVHEAIDNPVPAPDPSLTDAENAMITAAAGNAELESELQLQARLLHALDENGVNAQLAADELEEGARLLLARLSIQMPDLSAALEADENDQVVNPNDISVNNLVRPFLMTPSQLAYLRRTTGA
ncbi:MAG: hypothetical protein PVG22_01500 [Chromatiales bacterium]|jgi:hypothetical protein